MKLLPEWLTAAFYLIAAVCFILALKGLSGPRTARRGNLIGAAGAALAVVTVFLSTDFQNAGRLIAAIVAVLIGGAVAVPIARKIQMTKMPQLVAILNGVGGGAAAVVGIIELVEWQPLIDALPFLTKAGTSFAILVGALSFAGSIITYLKLDGKMTSKPVVIPGAKIWMFGTMLASAGVAIAVAITGNVWLGVLLIALGLLSGVLMVLPVGGADVPIVISLLNAFTGLAVRPPVSRCPTRSCWSQACWWARPERCSPSRWPTAWAARSSTSSSPPSRAARRRAPPRSPTAPSAALLRRTWLPRSRTRTTWWLSPATAWRLRRRRASSRRW